MNEAGNPAICFVTVNEEENSATVNGTSLMPPTVAMALSAASALDNAVPAVDSATVTRPVRPVTSVAVCEAVDCARDAAPDAASHTGLPSATVCAVRVMIVCFSGRYCCFRGCGFVVEPLGV